MAGTLTAGSPNIFQSIGNAWNTGIGDVQNAVGSLFGVSNAGNLSFPGPQQVYAASNSIPGTTYGPPSQVSYNVPGPNGNMGNIGTGQVAGANTGSSGGSNNNPPANTNTGSAPTVNLPSIDSLFSGEMNFLQGLQPQVQADKSAALADVTNQYGGQNTDINNQTTGLNNQLGIDTTNFNQGMNSAYSQAQNAYNQLLQRNLAMYGGGSSAGPAIAAILGQGYQQQTGQLQGQDVSGHQNLNQQGQNITTWAQQQHNTLNNWRDQANLTINQQAQQALDQINNQMGMAEDAKANARMDILTNVINQQQALQNYDVQLRNQIAMIQQMNGPQSFGINQYNPGNYQALLNGIEGNIQGMPLSLQNAMLQSAGMNPQQSQAMTNGLFNSGFVGNSQNGQDFLNNIISPGFNPNSQTTPPNINPVTVQGFS